MYLNDCNEKNGLHGRGKDAESVELEDGRNCNIAIIMIKVSVIKIAIITNRNYYNSNMDDC